MDINQLKDKLNKLNGKAKQNDIWKPKDEHEIRFVPQPGGKDPIVEAWFHYDIGDVRSVLCPKLNHGDHCPICEFADMLKSWKDPKTGEDKPESERRADFEIFKKIQPKPQYFAAIIERGKESEGTKWIKLTTSQLRDQLLPLCADGDRLAELNISKDDSRRHLDILFSVDKAYDVAVSYAKVGQKGNNKSFPITTFKGKIKTSALTMNKIDANKIISSVKPFSEVYPKQSSSEVEHILEKFVNTPKEDEPVKSNDAGVQYNKPQKNSTEDAKTVGKKSLEEAFDDLSDDN